MPLSKTELNHADNFLYYINKSIKQKGYMLYQSGGVRYRYFDPDTQNLHFQVKGNVEESYQVQINLSLSPEPDFFSDYDEEEDSSCECIYFEQELECKHVAAALYFILHNKKSDFKKILSDEPKDQKSDKITAFPISIPCSLEEMDKFHELIPDDPNNNYYDANLKSVKFLENGIIYYVSGYSYMDELSVTYDEGQVTINGSIKRPHLVRAGLKWLKIRFEGKDKRELGLLTREQREKMILMEVEEMGLKEQLKDPLSAMDFVLHDQRIIMISSGELNGLVNLDQYKSNFTHYLNQAKIKSLGMGSFQDTKEVDIGTYNVAFAFCYNQWGSFTEIIPFMAKGSKKDPEAFSVKFERLDDPHDIRLKRNQDLERILFLRDRFQKSLLNKSSMNPFDQFREFYIAAKEYPLFVFKGFQYETHKIRKAHFDKPLEAFKANAQLLIDKGGVIYNIRTIIEFGDNKYDLAELQDQIIFTQVFAVYKNQALLLFDSERLLKLLAFQMKNSFIQVLDKEFDQYFKHILLPMASFIEISDKTGTLKESENPGPLQKQLYISELNGLILLRPQVKYAESAFSNPLEQSTIIDADNKAIYLRDEDYEDEYVEFLRKLHPNFKNAGSQGLFYLNQDSFMKDLWFFKAFEKLKSEQVRVFGLEKIKIKKYNPFPPAISMEFGSTQDWFEVSAKVAFGDQKVKLKDIKKALDRDQEFVELADGSIGVLPQEWVKKFSKLFRSGEAEKEGLKVPKTLFHVLDEFEEAQSFPEVIRELEEKKAKLAEFTQIKTAKIPKKLKAELRKYQHTGLNWLNFLQEYQWGGILADDMGLGKTLQMIALICKLIEQNKKAKVLVVAPTTLLFNWRNELEKFAPHLGYFVHHGNRSDSLEELSQHQVILTSYGLVINDLPLLQQIHFEAIIADESQAIKNTQSQRYKAITKLKGKVKMAMTGTPIENSLAELFAQMNFVNPGFFLSFKSFKDNYLKPLKNGDREILSELQHKIKPFVLRRTKEEVLTELPDKTEEYLYCVMKPAQRKIYDAYRNEYRDYLLKKFEEEGAENSKMYVLEGLTKLRLACDATNLVQHTEAANESVKIEMLLEHILEKTGKHKILVFSQFVKMLALVQEKLEDNLIEYAYLDGKTSLKERENVVQQFQQDEKKRVFLISLKAGGTGLNLTAADYVYVLDPWWNPAVENQAIDRCYRMGQEKHVIAYRMICKDTVEEKIMQLQQAKSKLAKEVISEGDSFLGALDRESMLALFE
ncbi:DEAD/DEAH box helicase [Arthrospiribacter ruber]|uniref:Superfamily II DNA or RNA helicase, SNF2 family n=1 Tax=Arthrospiribacter ruber TaxID=2487934 RepID=A0A951MCF0_9BACT|nr:DEAD/DEAH box helicase [Arthrospiribacter ruber]MBW3467442.1 hypothetical protein [Arthrospiribacter ruber]